MLIAILPDSPAGQGGGVRCRTGGGFTVPDCPVPDRGGGFPVPEGVSVTGQWGVSGTGQSGFGHCWKIDLKKLDLHRSIDSFVKNEMYIGLITGQF